MLMQIVWALHYGAATFLPTADQVNLLWSRYIEIYARNTTQR